MKLDNTGDEILAQAIEKLPKDIENVRILRIRRSPWSTRAIELLKRLAGKRVSKTTRRYHVVAAVHWQSYSYNKRKQKISNAWINLRLSVYWSPTEYYLGVIS